MDLDHKIQWVIYDKPAIYSPQLELTLNHLSLAASSKYLQYLVYFAHIIPLRPYSIKT